MKIFDILDKLQTQIEGTAYVPFTGRIMLEKDEILDYIDELRAAIPEDIEEGKKIKESEERIRQQAKKEAGSMIREAREHKQQLLDADSLMRTAKAEADEILKEAKIEANRITTKSLDYICSLFTKAQGDMRSAVVTMENNKKELEEKKEYFSKATE